MDTDRLRAYEREMRLARRVKGDSVHDGRAAALALQLLGRPTAPTTLGDITVNSAGRWRVIPTGTDYDPDFHNADRYTVEHDDLIDLLDGDHPHLDKRAETIITPKTDRLR